MGRTELAGLAKPPYSAALGQRRRRSPLEHRVAGGARLVETAARSVVGRAGEARRVALLRRDGEVAQCRDEEVEEAFDLDSVGSISMAPWTTSGKYMVIGW